MIEELKPCPFCGGKAEPYQYRTNEFSTRCKRCYADCGPLKDPYEAAYMWNARPIEDEKDKEIKRLKGNWDYLKEYFVALRNSRLHEENLLSSEMNRYNILFLDGVIEKMNTANNNVGSMEVNK